MHRGYHSQEGTGSSTVVDEFMRVGSTHPMPIFLIYKAIEQQVEGAEAHEKHNSVDS
jgi:hypothetical protein